jgi:hypothetical protein
VVKSTINVDYGTRRIYYNWWVPYPADYRDDIEYWCMKQFKRFDWYKSHGMDTGYHFVSQKDALLFELRWG